VNTVKIPQFPVTGYCEHGKDPSVSMRVGEFFSKRNFWLLKKLSDPCRQSGMLVQISLNCTIHSFLFDEYSMKQGQK
jgi:hypothetical protein